VETTNSNASDQKALVENIKGQWKLLWNERFNDKLKAEGISAKDYELLRVDRGTVIQATRDFKPLNLKEVLEQNKIETPERFIQPTPQVGGWNKFVKTKITSQPKNKHHNASDYTPKKTASMQPKKGGRGWLHKQ
jgi:hypothetical protein